MSAFHSFNLGFSRKTYSIDGAWGTLLVLNLLNKFLLQFILKKTS